MFEYIFFISFLFILKFLYHILGARVILKLLKFKRARSQPSKCAVSFFDEALRAARLNCLQKSMAYIFFLHWFGKEGRIFVSINRHRQGHSWVESDFFYNPTMVTNEDRKSSIPLI